MRWLSSMQSLFVLLLLVLFCTLMQLPRPVTDRNSIMETTCEVEGPDAEYQAIARCAGALTDLAESMDEQGFENAKTALQAMCNLKHGKPFGDNATYRARYIKMLDLYFRMMRASNGQEPVADASSFRAEMMAGIHEASSPEFTAPKINSVFAARGEWPG